MGTVKQGRDGLPLNRAAGSAPVRAERPWSNSVPAQKGALQSGRMDALRSQFLSENAVVCAQTWTSAGPGTEAATSSASTGSGSTSAAAGRASTSPATASPASVRVCACVCACVSECVYMWMMRCVCEREREREREERERLCVCMKMCVRVRVWGDEQVCVSVCAGVGA